MISYLMPITSFFRPAKAAPPQTHLDENKPGQGTLFQKLRLWSGLVLMIYVVFHFVNHSLGNISLQAMDRMLIWQVWIWQSLPGTILLILSLFTHVTLVIWKLVTRKTFRLPVWEWLQIILGLLIPYLLVTHVIAMRSPVQDIGIYIDYSLALGLMWPASALAQSFLLLITWIHGCLGLHFWLRLYSWYDKYIRYLIFLAATLPDSGYDRVDQCRTVECFTLSIIVK